MTILVFAPLILNSLTAASNDIKCKQKSWRKIFEVFHFQINSFEIMLFSSHFHKNLFSNVLNFEMNSWFFAELVFLVFSTSDSRRKNSSKRGTFLKMSFFGKSKNLKFIQWQWRKFCIGIGNRENFASYTYITCWKYFNFIKSFTSQS